MSRQNNNNRRRQQRNRGGHGKPTESKTDNIDILWGFNKRENIRSQITKSCLVSRDIMLPISTRAVGFIISCPEHNFYPFYEDKNKWIKVASALYRFTLLQLELKLKNVMKMQCSRNIGSSDQYADLNVNSEQMEICQQIGAMFKPLYELIDSIGIFNCKNSTYIPCMPKRSCGIERIDPCLVLFSNLRDYVEALSDPNTPQAIRKHFYDHNPIPTAKWSSKDDPILENPEEIMPENYNNQELKNDLNIIRNATEIITRKYPHCVFKKILKYDSTGNEFLLSSCELLATNCKTNQSVICEWWIINNLSDNRGINPQHLLFGEIPKKESVENFSIYTKRTESLAKLFMKGPFKFSFNITEYFEENLKPQSYISISKAIITLPISTRGIGFIISNNYESKDEEFMNALYRVTLLQAQIKICGYYYTDLVHSSHLDEMCNQCSRNLIPLSNLIAMLRKEFDYDGVHYKIEIPQGSTNPEFAFDPCLIQFSNLRSYVEALSNPSTSARVRKYFYDHSPLPGAKWNVSDINSPILENPDNIMPENYDNNLLDDDINVIHRQLRKRPSDDDSDDVDNVNPNVFITSEKIHKIEIKDGDGTFFPSCKMLSKSSSKFHVWSSEAVKDVEFYLGRLYLFGEIPRPGSVDNFDQIYAPRMLSCAKFETQTWRVRPLLY